MAGARRRDGLLRGARVYLSGPMDFVASPTAEKQSGWRNRVSQFLQGMGVTVFDPWYKPDVRGLHEYGREDAKSGERIKKRWTYAGGKAGAQARVWCAKRFWETLHIDLRMVDTSDFGISKNADTKTTWSRRLRGQSVHTDEVNRNGFFIVAMEVSENRSDICEKGLKSVQVSKMWNLEFPRSNTGYTPGIHRTYTPAICLGVAPQLVFYQM